MLVTRTLRSTALAGLVPALLVFASVGFGFSLIQESGKQTPAIPQPPGVRKIDDFGPQYGCSGGARMDNFAIELDNEPNSTGYIVAYESTNHAPGTAKAYGDVLRNYLVEMRGLEESRVKLVGAGSHSGDKLKIELWLVPQGAEPPAFASAKEKKAERAFGGKFDEYDIYDDTQFYDTEGGEPGDYEIGVTYAAFGELLKQQPDSQGYIVVYSKPGAAPGYWRRVGTREQQKLISDGVGPERFTIINGGVNKPKASDKKEENEEDLGGRVELWVGEKDKPPVKQARERQGLTEAVLVGTGDNYPGLEESNEWALNNLAEMLRSDASIYGCIIVFSGNGSLVTNAEGVEVPSPDVFKKAESWKAELLKKFGIEESRLVLMHGPSDEFGAGRIEAWAVPRGAAMPDPFTKKDDGEDQSGENPKEF